MIEYGFMDGGYLRSRFIEETTRSRRTDDGEIVVERYTVEQQIADLSKEWKPVDPIDESKMISDNEDYVVVLVPYDAGDHIAYEYVTKFDVRKVRTEIEALKTSLSESDYKITKCYEASLLGDTLPYDVKELHAERQAQRDKINELEALL